MQGQKHWYESRTIWASLIAALAAVATLFGHGMTEEQQGALADALTLAAPAVAGVAGILAAIFRAKATTTVLSPTDSPPIGSAEPVRTDPNLQKGPPT